MCITRQREGTAAMNAQMHITINFLLSTFVHSLQLSPPLPPHTHTLKEVTDLNSMQCQGPGVPQLYEGRSLDWNNTNFTTILLLWEGGR